MDAPKISVIVPLYRTEEFVEKCLRSIMEQSFKNIEIVCIDDCSPDGSASVVRRLAAEDARIVLIEHDENLGLGGARNTGIKAARAEYLASVDSDDYVGADFLQELWDGAEDGYYDVVVAGYREVSPDGTLLKLHRGKNKVIDPLPEDLNPIRVSDPAFWNKLWRKSLFIDNEILFPLHIYHQDSATTPLIYSRAERVKFIRSSQYNYLIHSKSVTQSRSDKHLLDRYRCVDVLKEFFIQDGTYNKLKGALQERVLSGYSYHAGNVVKNIGTDRESVDRYLGYLLMMRDAYLKYDDVLRTLSLEEKAQLLLKHQLVEEGAASLGRPLLSSVGVKETPPVKKYKARPALPQTPKVLVLTLFSGEGEFEESKASLRAQTHKAWEHVVIRGLGNLDAHKVLYNTIMSRRDEFDLFLKLDADMCFVREDALLGIIEQFRGNSFLDHLVIACDDFMSGDQILGVHTFSNRVSWKENSRGIFNDPDPKRPGSQTIVHDPYPSLFQHSGNPSAFQAFHFGAHRALKLVQRGATVEQKRVMAMNNQWRALKGVWNQLAKGGDRRHALALVAADLVVNERLGEGAHDYFDRELASTFERFGVYSTSELSAVIRASWANGEAQTEYFAKAVGRTGLQKLALAGSWPEGVVPDLLEGAAKADDKCLSFVA